MRFTIYQDSAIGARNTNQDRMGYCFSREALLAVALLPFMVTTAAANAFEKVSFPSRDVGDLVGWSEPVGWWSAR